MLLIGLAAAAHQGWSANAYTLVSDIMPKRAVSSVVGLGGFVSGLASMGVSQAVGALLTKNPGGYVPVFAWASIMYLLALLVLQGLVPRIAPLPDDASRGRPL